MSFLYLASQSPRRRELLAQIGVQYKVLPVSIVEQCGSEETPVAYVQRLALEKAKEGFHHLTANNLTPAPVLGADTIGLLNGRVLEKPVDKNDAVSMLGALSGTCHEILTAVAMVAVDKQKVLLNRTLVQFRELSAVEIEQYWDAGEPIDKAGAYAIQGFAGVFVESIEGSYSAVVGLPLMETHLLLKEFNVPCWSSFTENKT